MFLCYMAGRDAYLLRPVVFLLFVVLVFDRDEDKFIYNGFRGAHLHLDGLAEIYPSGLLQLTNTSLQLNGHAFYPRPIKFTAAPSFSTTFVFGMYPEVPHHSGSGIAFVISPSTNFEQAVTAEYLGLFNVSNNGNKSNHIFAVELDTVQNAIFNDIDGNHLGIDVNDLRSVDSASAAYYSNDDGGKRSLLLTSGKPMQVWIDYNGEEMLVNVTIAPLKQPKPKKALLSTRVDLSVVLLDSMHIGFSSSTGLSPNEQYILGWSWSQIGQAPDLDPAKLPPLPKFGNGGRMNLAFPVLLVLAVLLLLVIAGVAWSRWKKKYEELYEPWEKEYAPHRFSYKDLFEATKGFRESELLGVGGFGKVYKGALPSTHAQIAVKRVSHDSKQGMKEFVAEISSMRRLRHKNLVQLLGYCRRKGELLLVYDYMPNGSLDKFLFGDNVKSKLSWSQRFKIIKGVASALLYLHEEWEQVVLHRDVKASNVLLDAEMNARLGDFGLARLYDHNTNPQTTHVVGTMGYIAPEACRTRKPSTFTDVYSFGMFLLEVSCGRRPIDNPDAGHDFVLVDWVYECWKKGAILEAGDPKLEESYAADEMELVLKLGLLCVHPKAEERPAMRQVVRFLDKDSPIPDIPYDLDPEKNGFLLDGWGTSASIPLSYSSIPLSSSGTASVGHCSSVNSVLQSGR